MLQDVQYIISDGIVDVTKELRQRWLPVLDLQVQALLIGVDTPEYPPEDPSLIAGLLGRTCETAKMLSESMAQVYEKLVFIQTKLHEEEKEFAALSSRLQKRPKKQDSKLS